MQVSIGCVKEIVMGILSKSMGGSGDSHRGNSTHRCQVLDVSGWNETGPSLSESAGRGLSDTVVEIIERCWNHITSK